MPLSLKDDMLIFRARSRENWVVSPLESKCDKVLLTEYRVARRESYSRTLCNVRSRYINSDSWWSEKEPNRATTEMLDSGSA